MKRTPLHRLTPLRAHAPMKRGKPMRRRRLSSSSAFVKQTSVCQARRRAPDHADPAYLAWLREQPCRAPGLPRHRATDAHHLRHQPSGASIGAHVKDDRRAISLCRGHHGDIELGQGPWKGWTRAEIKAWESRMADEQRAEYLRAINLVDGAARL